jgi:4-amino-4-deoxy-L-arabinose transferase-like glycosyltransferase
MIPRRYTIAYYLLLILLVGLFFRTYALDAAPPGIDGDEMFNGWDAQRVWKGNAGVYFPANYGREPLHIHLLALTTRLLGVSAWTLRLPTALVGVVGLAIYWALARRLFNARVALLTTALVAVSLWPLRFDRIALRAGLQPVAQAGAVYALWRALDERSNRWAVAAGVLGGLVLYTYTAARIFPLVPAVWLAAIAATGQPLVRGNGRRLVIAGAVAALVVLPLAIFALRNPETYNSRVNALSYEVDRLREGDLEPLWRSIKGVAGMFTVQGDPKWRYNVSGRPLFDPVTGALFYLGLVLCLARARRPANLLLLVWLPVMLAPTVFSTSTPSFWRSGGALTPIYLLPAIGADFVWDQIARLALRIDPHGQTTRVVLTLLVVTGLVLYGASTWHGFFHLWAKNPEVLHTFEVDLAAAARYLDDHVPPGTPVWISSNYAGDLSRILLQFQTSYGGPMRWFDGNKATVWPASQAGQDVFLLFTRSSPPNPDALAALGDYSVHEESDGAGRPHLWVYRVPGESLRERPWQPEDTLAGRFTGNREMLGYDVAPEVERGGETTVVLYWRVPAGVRYDSNDVPYSYVCLLESTTERCLEQESHYQGYPIWDWVPGDVVAQRYALPIPAYAAPQTTHVLAGLYTGAGEIGYTGETGSGGLLLLLGPVEVAGSPSVDPLWDEQTAKFGGDLALVGHHVPAEVSPGSALPVELHWQAMRAPDRDYVVRLELVDEPGETLLSSEAYVGSERHPTTDWVEGEPLHTFHDLRIPPEQESTTLDLVLAVRDGADGGTVGGPLSLCEVVVAGRPHSFDPPSPDHPLEADFGSGIRLLGYALNAIDPSPGGQIEVVLYWHALGTVEEDYKVFVHLYDPAGERIAGQHDSPPGNGALPTSSWLPGEYVTDTHVVPVEPGATRGTGELGVGLYLPATGERPAVLVDGERQPDDVLVVTVVEIK